jgi:hypothetical protein
MKAIKNQVKQYMKDSNRYTIQSELNDTAFGVAK